MPPKIMSILLTFFIFVIVNQASADDVKSKENTANQGTIMKISESRVGLLKKTEPVEDSANQKKLKPRFQSTISYSDTNHGVITRSRTKLRFNFLKVLEQKRKLLLLESLDKMIYSFESFQDPWRFGFSLSKEINGTNSTHLNSGQVAPNRYLNPNPEKYLEEGKIQSTLRLLQLKREEMFNEIFVGFRFSFGAKKPNTLPEMTISPSLEKGAGLVIAF